MKRQREPWKINESEQSPQIYILKTPLRSWSVKEMEQLSLNHLSHHPPKRILFLQRLLSHLETPVSQDKIIIIIIINSLFYGGIKHTHLLGKMKHTNLNLYRNLFRTYTVASHACTTNKSNSTSILGSLEQPAMVIFDTSRGAWKLPQRMHGVITGFRVWNSDYLVSLKRENGVGRGVLKM